jgi:hypothetical protein
MNIHPAPRTKLISANFFNLLGNYTEFHNTMVEKLKAQQREYESQMEYRKHVQEFIDKFRYVLFRFFCILICVAEQEPCKFMGAGPRYMCQKLT